MVNRKILFKLRLILSKLAFGAFLMSRMIRYYGKKGALYGFLLPLIALLIFAGMAFLPPGASGQNKMSAEVRVFIPRGASLQEIAGLMVQKSLLNHQQIFILLGKLTGYQHQLKAGYFIVPRHLSPFQLLIYLTHPRVENIKITIPEGLPATEYAAMFSRKLGVDSTQFMRLVTDSAFCRQLGVPAKQLEGYLLPETYFFPYGSDPREIIRHLVNNTLSLFQADSVREQMRKLGMDMNQIITLASIIEGEAVVDSERALISSVYHNRLKRGWRLQADPTIQYIIPGPPRRLLLNDLEIDSPYNTYRYKGLPPGPINNPGKKSILAALFPANTRYMYFVATGDGGHHFSRTAAEHSLWKRKFDRIRRQVRRENRRRLTK